MSDLAPRTPLSEPSIAPAGEAPGGVTAIPVRRLRALDLWRVALRSFLIQALWNPERMQGQGLAHALRPVARRLAGRDGESAWLSRHLGYFNTHPVFASYALGVVARLEEERAAGAGPPRETIERVKSALGPALAALGDTFFWSTLRPLSAVVGVLWILQGSPWGPLVFWGLYNSFHLYARVRGVHLGRRLGLAVLGDGFRRRLSRIRGLLRISGVLAAAALVHLLAEELVAGHGIRGGLWMGVGLVLGLVWGEGRRLSPSALACALFLITLAWATLFR